MESIGSRALAEEAVRLFRLCFWAGRFFDNDCDPTRPRANSLDFHVLFTLLNHPNPNLTMSQLAEATISSKQHLSKLVGSMEEKGLVKREHDPVNRRQVYVRILPAGRALMEEMIEEVRIKFMQTVEIFSEQERQELHDSFMLFRRLIQKMVEYHNKLPIQEEA